MTTEDDKLFMRWAHENKCEHGQLGGEQFCVFCLRRIGDAAELRAETAERKLKQAEDALAAAERIIDRARFVAAAFREYDTVKKTGGS